MSVRHYWPITENDVYVRVFNEILQEIDLSFFDTKLITSYQLFPPESRYLITRMYLRSPKWIRFEDLAKYMSPETLRDVALPAIIKGGWVAKTPHLYSLLSDVATLSELHELGKSLGLKVNNTNRQKLVDQLTQLQKQQSFFNSGRVSTKISESLDIECYYLEDSKRNFLFQLEQLFLCPVGPDAALETIFLTHMKKQAFYPYKYFTQKERPIFDNAESFHAYARARELYVPILDALNNNDKSLQSKCVSHENLERLDSNMSQAATDQHKKAAYTLGRAIFNVSQILMKLHRFNDEYIWIQKYSNQKAHRSKRGVSLIRKLLSEIRFLGETQTKGESSWLVSAVNTYYDARAEVNEIELLDLNRKTTKSIASIRNTGSQSALSFITRPDDIKNPLAKIPTFEIIAIPKTSENTVSGPGTRVIYENGLNVEQLALEEYSTLESGSFEGGHFEGSIITTIFWLMSFDSSFEDPDHFRCAYQSFPLNLQQAIDEKCEAINGRLSDIESHITKNRSNLITYGEPRPIVGSINWLIPFETLISVLHGLGDQIGPIIRRLTSNYHKYSSGFPDLTLWNSVNRQTKFVEVKSENDTVSDNQQLWMEFSLQNGINVEVCKVIPTKRVVKRKRNSK